MCYEERVLYRLLSGMHASVNIHVALHANPPQSEDEEWLPDPARFAQLFENHPERLKKLSDRMKTEHDRRDAQYPANRETKKPESPNWR